MYAKRASGCSEDRFVPGVQSGYNSVAIGVSKETVRTLVSRRSWRRSLVTVLVSVHFSGHGNSSKKKKKRSKEVKWY